MPKIFWLKNSSDAIAEERRFITISNVTSPKKKVMRDWISKTLAVTPPRLFKKDEPNSFPKLGWNLALNNWAWVVRTEGYIIDKFSKRIFIISRTFILSSLVFWTNRNRVLWRTQDELYEESLISWKKARLNSTSDSNLYMLI